MTQPTKRKIGRPSKYSEALATKICERIATGATLHGLGKEKGFPSEETMYAWLREKEEFPVIYAHAKARRADRFVENFIDVLNDDQLDPHDKRTRLDGLKWLAAKFAPREFGDRPDRDKMATVNVILGDLSGQAKVIEGETIEPKRLEKK